MRWPGLTKQTEGDKPGKMSGSFAGSAVHATHRNLNFILCVGQRSQLWLHIDISERAFKNYQCPGAIPEPFHQKVVGGGGGRAAENLAIALGICERALRSRFN